MKLLINHLFCLLFFFIGIIQQTYSQTPFIQQYKGDGVPNFGVVFNIIQDKEGLMYISGFPTQIYDGVNWNTLKNLKGNVRSSVLDDDGMLLLGTDSDLGYVKNLSNGKKEFISLQAQLTPEEKSLPTIWNIHKTKEGIFFQGQRFVFLFQKQNNEYKKIKSFSSKADFTLSFLQNNQVYVTETNEKNKISVLYVIQNAEMKTLIERKEEKEEEKIITIIHGIIEKDSYLWLFTRKNGIFTINKNTKKIEKIKDKINELLKEAEIYQVKKLKNGNIGIATFYKGFFILTPDLKILYQLEEKNGLSANNIHTFFEDFQGNIWLGVSSYLNKVMLGLPVTLFDTYANLKDKVYDCLEHQGVFYAATNTGLYYFDEKLKRFILVEGTKSQCWELRSYGKGVIVAGGNEGAFYIENKKLLDKETYPNACFQMISTQKDSTLFLVPTYGGVRVTRFQNKKFKEIGYLKATEADCRVIVEHKNFFWVQSSKGIFRIKLKDTKNQNDLDKTEIQLLIKGLPNSKEPFLNVQKFGEELIFRSKETYYRFDEASQSFIAINPFRLNYKNPLFKPAYIYQNNTNKLWLLDKKLILTKENDGYKIDSTTLLMMPKRIYQMYENPKGTFYFPFLEGIYKYIPTNQTLPKFKTKIIAIHLSEDSLLNFENNIKILLPYQNNSLIFKFSALNFLEEKQTKFQFKLEGFDKEWSNWQKITQKEYTNLREGTYIFKVKSLSSYGQVGEETYFEFTILPPWYRTWWAYCLYGIFIVAFIYLIIKIYTKKLRQDKERLEKIVLERTHQIQQQNIELEQQKEEITAIAENLKITNEEVKIKNIELEQQKEEISTIAENLKNANEEITLQKNIIESKNKDVTESINYAKRIQTAMLPFEERILKALKSNNFFVIYQPRNIVSGDFYWFAEKENKYIVSVTDCTGHGVPGAFMSMVGDALFNQIVHDAEIHEPDLILNFLHKGIRRALNQAETNNRDGMDSVICKVEQQKQLIEVAGAKNTIYIILKLEEENDNRTFFQKNKHLLNNQKIKFYYENGENITFTQEWTENIYPTKILIEIKGDTISIGGEQREMERIFTKHSLYFNEIKNPTIYVYLLSDGFQDQFGGDESKKFGLARLRTLFFQISKTYSLEKQKGIIQNTLQNWTKNNQYPQIDDITFMGIKVDF